MVEFGGLLEVKVVSGAGLLACDIGGQSDPYMALALGQQKLHTRTVSSSLAPQWNETVMLCWTGRDMLHLQVVVVSVGQGPPPNRLRR
jgi:Ca2+-dependent lipid-binding protein